MVSGIEVNTDENTDRLEDEDVAAAAVRRDKDAGIQWICMPALEQGSVSIGCLIKSIDCEGVEQRPARRLKRCKGSNATDGHGKIGLHGIVVSGC